MVSDPSENLQKPLGPMENLEKVLGRSENKEKFFSYGEILTLDL